MNGQVRMPIVKSMQLSGAITSKVGPSWKQSTVHTSTQSVCLQLMQFRGRRGSRCAGRSGTRMVWPHRSPPAMTWIKALPPRGRDHQAWPFPRGAGEPAPRPHLPTMSTQPTHEQIAALVDRFYDRIQVHPTLGPVFNAAVDDWDEHKRLLVSFWTSVVLRAGTDRGNPMAAHRPHPTTPEHFGQWLGLWRSAARRVGK